MIPKIIHQVYIRPPGTPIPPKIAENMEYLKRINPGWEYRLYEDEGWVRAYIHDNYGAEMLARYDRFNPEYMVMRVDLFRYLLLYNTGGVYLDLKSTIKRPLDEIILPDDEFLVSPVNDIQSYSAHLLTWFVVTSKNNPFIKAIIEARSQAIDTYRHRMLNRGAMAIIRVVDTPTNHVVRGLLSAHPHRHINYEKGGFVYSCFAPETNYKMDVEHHKIFGQQHYAYSAASPILEK